MATFIASYFQKSLREEEICNVIGKIKIMKELKIIMEKKREETHKNHNEYILKLQP